MELIDYVRMLGRRWIWWVTALVLGTALAVAYVHVAHKIYTATSDEFVASNTGSGATANDYLDSRSAILASMASYSAMVKSPTVCRGVLEDVPGVNLTASQVCSRISAQYVPRTVVLKVSAWSSKPTIAAELATAAAKRLGTAIQDVETPKPGSPSSVRVVVTRPAAVPAAPSSPNKTLDIALGVLAGLGIGLVSASLRDQAKRSRPVAFTGGSGTVLPTPASSAAPPIAPPIPPAIPSAVPPHDARNGSAPMEEPAAWASSAAVGSEHSTLSSTGPMDPWGDLPGVTDEQAVADADITPPSGHSRY